MRCGAVVALVAATAVCACGAEDAIRQDAAPAAAVSEPHDEQRRCVPAGRVTAGPLALCHKRSATASSGWLEAGGRRLEVEHPYGEVLGERHGSWTWAAASPDGRTILAQFTGECEVPTAFFIPATGGTPRSVSGASTRKEPPEDSVALGWTTDGRAIVFIPAAPGCGSTDGPGVFLVSPSGETEKVASVPPRERPALDPSLRARSVAAVAQALGAG